MLDHLLKENALDRFVDATYVGRAERWRVSAPARARMAASGAKSFILNLAGRSGLALDSLRVTRVRDRQGAAQRKSSRKMLSRAMRAGS
jgi:hypothetical protein